MIEAPKRLQSVNTKIVKNAGINEYREGQPKPTKKSLAAAEHTETRLARSVTPVYRGLSAQASQINRVQGGHQREVIYIENSAENLANQKIAEERSSECHLASSGTSHN
jgi:hypothetical protein